MLVWLARRYPYEGLWPAIPYHSYTKVHGRVVSLPARVSGQVLSEAQILPRWPRIPSCPRVVGIPTVVQVNATVVAGYWR